MHARSARRIPRTVVAPCLCVLLLAPAAVSTQEPLSAPAPGANLTVHLLTIGPGDAVWEVWGHNALWITDPDAGIDVAYNWGMFSFDEAGFIPRLAKGTMLYWMEGFSGERLLRGYAAANRDIWAQELNLTPEQRAQLFETLQRTDTPENRYYRYDYYRDNCSTRVRDALDVVLGGRIGAALRDVETGVTWRWHARRILRGMPLAYAGMQFALGTPADGPVTAWDEGFLPLLLMQHLRSVSVLDPDGAEVPLVVGETHLFEARRSTPPDDAPFWLPWFLLGGLALGGLVVGAGSLAARSSAGARALAPGSGSGSRSGSGPRPGSGSDRTSRWTIRTAGWAAGGLGALWSGVVGLAGLFLLLAWLFTDHTFWYRNENLLQASPLSLLLAPLFPAALAGRGWAARWARPLALAVLGLSAAGLLLQVLPGFDQTNGEIIALALPVHAAVARVVMRSSVPSLP